MSDIESMAFSSGCSYQEQVDKKVEKMRKQLLTRRSFKRFQEGVRQQCIDEANKLMAIHQYELHCCKSGFQALCAATYRASQVRQGYERHGQVSGQEIEALCS